MTNSIRTLVLTLSFTLSLCSTTCYAAPKSAPPQERDVEANPVKRQKLERDETGSDHSSTKRDSDESDSTITENRPEILIQAAARAAQEGDNITAIQNLVQCVDLEDSDGNHVLTGMNRANALIDLALLEVEEGKYQDASISYEMCLELEDETGHLILTGARRTQIFVAQGDAGSKMVRNRLDKTIKPYNEALQLTDNANQFLLTGRERAYVYNRLANLYDGLDLPSERKHKFVNSLRKCLMIRDASGQFAWTGADRAKTLKRLGQELCDMELYSQAARVMQEYSTVRSSLKDPLDTIEDYADGLYILGMSLEKTFKLAAAEAAYNDAYKELMKSEAKTDLTRLLTQATLERLGFVLSAQGKYEKVETRYRELLSYEEESTSTEALTPSQNDYFDLTREAHAKRLFILAYSLFKQQKYDQAEKFFKQCLDVKDSSNKPAWIDGDRADALLYLSRSLSEQGDKQWEISHQLREYCDLKDQPRSHNLLPEINPRDYTFGEELELDISLTSRDEPWYTSLLKQNESSQTDIDLDCGLELAKKVLQPFIGSSPSLSLEISDIGDSDAREIAFLPHMEGLWSLKLRAEDLNGRTVESLLLQPSLIHLDLKWQESLNSESVNFFIDALRFNRTLEFLDLSRTEIGDDGAKLLAQAIRDNCGLKVLDLRGSPISNVGRLALVKAMKQSSLRELLM